MRVHLRPASESLTWRCVTLSSALVASSNMRMLGLAQTARAMRIRWRCPPEMPPEPSLTSVCMSMGIWRMSSATPASSAASHASSTVARGLASVMFERMVPAKRLPFCRQTPMFRLRLRTSKSEMSWPP